MVFIACLFFTGVLNSNLGIDRVKTIFDDPNIPDSISKHQADARYVPYTLRKIIFNQWVYSLSIVKNALNFLNIYNLNKILLIINLYPIYLGFLKSKNKWLLVPVLFGLLAIGINKMVDARSASLALLPILFYYYAGGIKFVDRKIYLTGLGISLLFLI